MTDVASELYQRNFERVSAGGQYDSLQISQATGSGSGRYSAVYEYLEANPGKRVLELGCGGPAIPRLVAPLCADYTVVDIVGDRFGDDLPKNVHTIVSNLDHDFPVPDQAFDVVVALMVFEHLYNPFHSFAELARVLRPGGTAFVNLPNIASIRCRLALLQGKLPYTSIPDWFRTGEWDGSHLHYFTAESVRQICAHNGLQVTEMRAVGNFAWLKRLRPTLFCHEITYVIERAK